MSGLDRLVSFNQILTDKNKIQQTEKKKIEKRINTYESIPEDHPLHENEVELSSEEEKEEYLYEQDSSDDESKTFMYGKLNDTAPSKPKISSLDFILNGKNKKEDNGVDVSMLDDEAKLEKLDEIQLEDEGDDIELDEREIEAYKTILNASKKIKQLERAQENPNAIARANIRYSEAIYKEEQLVEKLKKIGVSMEIEQTAVKELVERFRKKISNKSFDTSNLKINKQEAIGIREEWDKNQQSDWDRFLSVTSATGIQVQNHEDDIERETAFYRQTLTSALEGIHRLGQDQIPWERPDDYFAEMVKSDEHMANVKEKLLYNKKMIEKREKMRKIRDLSRYGKRIQIERMKQQVDKKKENLEMIKLWRRKHGKQMKDFDMDEMEKEVKEMKEKKEKEDEGKSKNVKDVLEMVKGMKGKKLGRHRAKRDQHKFKRRRG